MPDQARSAHAASGRVRAIDRPLRSAGRRRQDAARALAVAGLCLAGLALTWVVSALVPSARVRDAVTLHQFTLLSRPHVDTVAQALLHALEPVPFTVLAALLVVIALMRRRPRVAVAVACVMTLAPLSSEVLKPLLAHAHDHVAGTYIAAASWPSGHATAALTLALCAALVAPRRLRGAVLVIGCLFSLAVGISLLILAWHMPSDVIGGYLVAMLWVALAVAALRAANAPRTRTRARAMAARA